MVFKVEGTGDVKEADAGAVIGVNVKYTQQIETKQAQSYRALSRDRPHPAHSQLPPQLPLVAHERSVRIAPEIGPLSRGVQSPILQNPIPV